MSGLGRPPLARVVNLSHHKHLRPGRELPPGWVYVGRREARGGWDLPAHPLRNPLPLPKPVTPAALAANLAAYEAHVWADTALIDAVSRLMATEVLACWCAPPAGLDVDDAPLVCHGQVLLRVMEDLLQADRELQRRPGTLGAMAVMVTDSDRMLRGGSPPRSGRR